MSDANFKTSNAVDNAYWANKIVPLAPTDFPREIPASSPPVRLVSNAVPSVGATDPFVSPSMLESLPSFSQNPETVENQSLTPTDLRQPMEVEVVGQTGSKQAVASECSKPPISEEIYTAQDSQTPSFDSDSSNHGVDPLDGFPHAANEAKSVQADRDIDVYLSVSDFAVASSESRQYETADSPNYWHIFSATAFVPGVTPVEAYPVCQEFTDWFADQTVDDFHPDPTAHDTAVHDAAPEDSDDDSPVISAPVFSAPSCDESVGNECDPELDGLPAEEVFLTQNTGDSNPGDHDPSAEDFIDVTRSLPQLPTSDRQHVDNVFDSVENSLAQLHASVNPTGDGEPFSSEPALSFPPAIDQAIEENAPEPVADDNEQVVDTSPVDQVITVDGNDGFDFLDLKSFRISQAVFASGSITLDTGQTKIRVEYQNIDLAIFADDVEVSLRH